MKTNAIISLEKWGRPILERWAIFDSLLWSDIAYSPQSSRLKIEASNVTFFSSRRKKFNQRKDIEAAISDGIKYLTIMKEL
jgi:hypothetical protein